MSEELLGCPFCGGQPTRIDRPSDFTKSGHFWIASCMCGGYSARAHITGETEVELIENWNRRSLPEQVKDLVTVARIYATIQAGNGDHSEELSDLNYALASIPLDTDRMKGPKS